MTIPHGQLQTIDMTVDKLGGLDPDRPLSPGQGIVVRCDQQITAGYAWQFATGPQMRLVVPRDGTLDATVSGKLDLDCDDVGVEQGKDCDDLSSAFHVGAQEMCPTDYDYDCDGVTTKDAVCSYGGPAGNLCDGKRTCTADNSAACIANDPNTLGCICADGRCKRCLLQGIPSNMPGVAQACVPASSPLRHDLCSFASGCQVVVAGKPADFDVSFTNTQGTVMDTVTVAMNEQVIMRVDYAPVAMMEPLFPPGMPFAPLIDLKVKALSGGGELHYVYRLEVEGPQSTPRTFCGDAVGQTSVMTCTDDFVP
jgi:hypothetical protein